MSRLGTTFGPVEYHITRADLVRYAGASGDFNPIHWSERQARSVGLPDVIAHGMLTMAHGARFVGEWIGDPTAVVEYGVRFSRPVVVGDDEGAVVTWTGTVTDAEHPDGLVLQLEARAADGPVLQNARAIVRAAEATGGAH